jgi:hypothetical protein
MPYTVRVFTDAERTQWTDHEFDSMAEAQSQIWGRGEDPYDNDDRPIEWLGDVGFDIYDPDGVCVDSGPTGDRVGEIKA